MCVVKSPGVGIPNDKSVAKSSPAFWEFPLPMGFSNCTAQGEPKQTESTTQG
jgi:hypothetical protein